MPLNPNDKVQLKPLTGKVVQALGEVNGKTMVRAAFTVGGQMVVVDLPVIMLAGN